MNKRHYTTPQTSFVPMTTDKPTMLTVSGEGLIYSPGDTGSGSGGR